MRKIKLFWTNKAMREYITILERRYAERCAERGRLAAEVADLRHQLTLANRGGRG